MFKNYTVGSFKVEIVFWMMLISTLTRYSAAGTVLKMIGIKDMPFLFYVDSGFVLFLTFIGTMRLMYATTKYFDIAPKVTKKEDNE